MEGWISYEHPEAVICKRIEQALQARGHSVWFDEDQITHGADGGNASPRASVTATV